MTDRANDDPMPHLLKRVRAAVQAGIDCVQIREKDLQARQLLTLVREIMAIAKRSARTQGALVHVNDRLDVALAARANGVHLGSESLPVDDAVRWCREGNAPAGFQLGVSCHSTESARDAERKGADFIFFGPVFDTPSKRAFGPPQGVDRLREVCGAVRIPVLAIGGVNQRNAQECICAGASGVAAIRLFQETDEKSVREFTARLHQ